MGKPDYSGYHDCPCRDCFEIAIGGRIRSHAERLAIANTDRPRDPDTGRFLGRDAGPDDVAEEDKSAPALCWECGEAGCDGDGLSDCLRDGAYDCDDGYEQDDSDGWNGHEFFGFDACE